MKAVVTGGCGFIGSALVRKIAARHWDILLYDNFSRFGPSHLGEYKEKVTIVRGNVEDFERLQRVVKGADVVFHLAANSRQSGSMESPGAYFGPNAIGTYNVAEACRNSSTRVIYISTCAVYDKARIRRKIGISEEAPLGPETPYALSKKVGEDWLNLYNRAYDEESVIFRLPNVYGPGDKERIIQSIIAKAIRNENITIFGDPHHLNFVHVEDIADALVLAATKRKIRHRIFNLGSRRNVNLKNLARLIIRMTGSASQVLISALPDYEPDYLRPSIELARKELGYDPKRTLADGIREMIQR